MVFLGTHTEDAMQKKMNDLWFKLMALEYRLKSRSDSIRQELEAAGIRPGMRLLDFGCGPGRYTLPAAEIVGAQGAVCAFDVHPLALITVDKEARRRGLTSVCIINSDCETGLDAESVDVVLLYYALHDIEKKEAVLNEIHRILRREGRLLYKDHTNLVSLMLSSGFCLSAETPAQFLLKKY